MSEQGQEKKKRGLCRQIFKWIGLGLLSLLIIAAIFLHAPWKVITLLLVILAACTILPKHFRKWFWLSAAAVLIALIIWVFLPDDNEDWRPYTFDEERDALEAKYAIPDEENAAMIYNELFEDFDIDSNQPEFFVRLSPSSISEPWLSKDHPGTAEWLKTQQSTIETLMQASKIEECQFSIPSDMLNLGQSMETSASMRQCVFLLVSAANNDIAEGRIDRAIEKNIAILQMAKHQYQQPTTIDMLVGIAIESLATNQFNRFVISGDATEERLSIIEKAVADIKHDWSDDFPRILEREKLMFKNFLGLFYALNTEGRIRLNPGIAIKTIMTRLPEDMKNEIKLKYWQRKLMKTSTIWAWFYMPSTPQKATKIIDASYERYYAMAEPDFDWQREPPELLSFLTRRNFTQISFSFNYLIEHTTAMSEGTYYSLHNLYLRTDAEQRGTLIIIALRRYKNENGRWPDSLDDIKSIVPEETFVDPINEGPFVYKLTDDNFTLYSKGKNNIDEAGKYESKRDPNTYEHTVEKDDRLIWPPRTNKTKEENADAER